MCEYAHILLLHSERSDQVFGFTVMCIIFYFCMHLYTHFRVKGIKWEFCDEEVFVRKCILVGNLNKSFFDIPSLK